MKSWRILQGNALAMLRTLESESVQCVVTSPPYWGLRDYKHDDQIGLEEDPNIYISKLVDCFAELRRVLKKDGTLWLNLGDCYATGAGEGKVPGGGGQGNRWQRNNGHWQPNRRKIEGLKPKDLVGIPWRVAFALQTDGWWLRSDIIWSKPNPMPESIRDRPTKSHEYLFLMSKSRRYYYDADAIAEKSKYGISWGTPSQKQYAEHARGGHGFRTSASMIKQKGVFHEKRNKRSVWRIRTTPFPESHFAVFPEKLVEPCILAGSRPDDLVLDPFCGSGTVGVISLRLNRHFIGIDLIPEYCAMARRRITNDAPLLNSVLSGVSS